MHKYTSKLTSTRPCTLLVHQLHPSVHKYTTKSIQYTAVYFLVYIVYVVLESKRCTTEMHKPCIGSCIYLVVHIYIYKGSWREIHSFIHSILLLSTFIAARERRCAESIGNRRPTKIKIKTLRVVIMYLVYSSSNCISFIKSMEE